MDSQIYADTDTLDTQSKTQPAHNQRDRQTDILAHFDKLTHSIFEPDINMCYDTWYMDIIYT